MTNGLTFRSYTKRVLITTSVLVNVILGGASNQTLSARNWQWKKENRYNAVWMIDKLLGEGHCTECWIYWKVREKKW